ncbi:hypothetical protein [Candidatus Marinarcus aquaticus]|uniref:Uncharacterized protein n=1 Tax=Candidatus Marinarcus aquaticus TaxID=2044504 RepID=A0A4Q0XRH7_9BACT|nr:hypothetical protein [Candidatus Marinarcus aquaticus]RXJ60087.1 hypothetical protein CRV04_03520 [Candidatus Marinarcus aquaticus]
MTTYKNIFDFIRKLKESHYKETLHQEIIKKIVNESDVIPEEDKEYMIRYMNEDARLKSCIQTA